jgi:ABC-type lipoprotein export system ATPase subunit
VTVEPPAEPVALATPALVQARRVTLSYDAPVLAEIDFELRGGDHLVVTGRSGSGKTSLLLVLAGLIAPTTGSVAWPGLSADPSARRAEIAMVFQAPSLLPELTALENVCLPLRLRAVGEGQANENAQAALAVVGATATADALPAELSGGQQQRVAVARALAGNPRVILADEPTGALDRVHAHQVVQALRGRAAELGAGLLLATHDEELAAGFPAQVVVEDGNLSRAA